MVHSGLADPAKIRSALSEYGFQWEIIQTVEKRFDPSVLNMLAPDLSDYLLILAQKGVSEISERSGHYYYSVWFYRAVLRGI